MGAYAEFAEGRKGVLKAGALADAVVLDADIEAIEPDDLQRVKVQATVVGGRLVHGA
jgi:predicted amidohydrolase YtcJ